jgi:hypothetical protein
MNTTTPLTRRTTVAAACLATLFAGVTACGTEHGTPAASGRPASSAELANAAKANQDAYVQRLQAEARAEAARQARAEHADAQRWAHGYQGDHGESFGDDHRQSQSPEPAPVKLHRARAHPPGYNKAALGEG